MFPWTKNQFKFREHLEEAHQELLEPLVPAFSTGGARVRISQYGSSCSPSAAELEGYSRPLWGIVAYSYGGGLFEYWELYRKGLVNGCNPNHSEFYGFPSDYDQILVDMAAIAYAICLCTKGIWDPLQPQDKQIVREYFQMASTKKFCDNNWKFFKVLIDLALEVMGIELTESTFEHLDYLESMYLQDGWYGDGIGKKHRIDYYNPFAFHYYSMIYYKLKKHQDPERCARFLERTSLFAKSFLHWSSDDGACLMYGRSLNYKFAAIGFWGIYASALDPLKEPPIPWGLMKSVYLDHFKWWQKQPIFNLGSKLLTLGYSYPNVFMTEIYNSPQSPYWSTKAFSGLLMGKQHPFWTSEPVPLSLNDKYFASIGMYFTHTIKNTTALINGPWNDEYQPEKYAKFAYSTRYGFGVITDHRNFRKAHLDNMIGFSFNNRQFFVRETYDAWVSKEGTMYSEWSPTEGIQVQSYIIPHHNYHIRMHTIHNDTDKIVFTKEGGFAVNMNGCKFQKTIEPEFALVETDTDYTIIKDLGGNRTPEVCQPDPNGNILYSKVLLPELYAQVKPKSTLKVCCAVSANPKENGIEMLDTIDFEGIDTANVSGLEKVLCNW